MGRAGGGGGGGVWMGRWVGPVSGCVIEVFVSHLLNCAHE